MTVCDLEYLEDVFKVSGGLNRTPVATTEGAEFLIVFNALRHQRFKHEVLAFF